MTMFSYNHEEHEKDYVEASIEFIDLTKMNRKVPITVSKLSILMPLIDLTTSTSHNRQNILDKIAPRLSFHIAFPGTTGNPLYDYIITDNFVTPEVSRSFQEKFLALPSQYQSMMEI